MISVIIPTYNEQQNISAIINYLKELRANQYVSEIIVVDGGSTDNTFKLAQEAGARAIKSEKKGRAFQMNCGAYLAEGEVLYFLHADSYPPENFSSEIIKAMKAGFKSGCFRMAFDHPHWFLRANAWFTRFNINWIRFGDQSLFVTKPVFVAAGGFNPNLIIMEDQEIVGRLQKYGKFKVIPATIITSARKYLKNGVYRLQAIFFLLCILYQLGLSQKILTRFYQKLIK